MSIFRRMANLLHRSRVDRDIDAELETHIALRTEDNVSAGMSPEEARRDALVRFGNRTVTKERVTAADAVLWIGSIGSDIRYASRQLVKNPGFALAAILSLTLGIGATVSVFSVIYGVLLHPFPYTDVERLANLSISDPRGNIFDAGFTGQQFRELRNVHGFEGIATWNSRHLTVTGDDVPENAIAFFGIGETFVTLGVPPLLGRNLGPSDSPEGQQPLPVVMLHYRFWQRHFHGDPGVIGKTLELNHRLYTIVGVTRPHFTWGWGADVYLPEETTQGGGVVVRLRPGVSLAAADAELQPLLERFAREKPHSFPPQFKVDIRPLTYETTQNMGGTLYLLFGAVAMLLAIGCSNVSILLLARGAARRHEFALRSAVGASNVRIVRQLLTESLLLAFTGTALGILIAYQLLRLLVAWLPAGMFPPDVAIRINVPVLLFTAGLALLSTTLFGLIPALQMAKPDISQVMQASTNRTAGSVRGKRLHSAFVAAQIALTLVLLTAAGAAVRGFLHLQSVPLGYNPHSVVSVGIPLEDNTYTRWEARVNYFEQLRASVATLPDIVSASIAHNATPPHSGSEQRFELRDKPSASPEAQTARVHFVDSGYFSTLQMPLLQGRTWSAGEVARGAALVVVNQTLARRYYPNGDIAGHVIKVSALQASPPDWLTAPGADDWMQVIGVVGDSVNDGLDHPVRPAIFAPYSTLTPTGTQILIRTRQAPEPVFDSIRKQLAKVSSDQQTYGVIADLETWIRNEPEWVRGRLISSLFGGFSIVALFLSGVGLYSVLSYSVAQRSNEFGIRMALGATRQHVLKVATASAGRSVGTGIAVGLILSFSLSHVVSTWVGGTTNHPVIVFGVPLLLLVVAGVACFVPARKALSINPIAALRSE
ncbi:MAG TPA: ABC transporter permease [Edaphobacter sp.]|nr:ABC transporter permease [Edaphobacter sp.]